MAAFLGQDFRRAEHWRKPPFHWMFDDLDEATAVMPMTDDPPNHQQVGETIANEGKPSDWWLSLWAARNAVGQRPQWEAPSESVLANRSNIGPVAWGSWRDHSNHLLKRTSPTMGGRSLKLSGRECRQSLTVG
jgi:hypothetical protein